MAMLRGSRMVNRIQPSKEGRLRSSAPYTSKIIKAGALIGDTKVLFSNWETGASVDENIDRIQRGSAGKYGWLSIGKQLRQKGLVK